LSNLKTRTSYGDSVIQRTDSQPAFSHDLLERVLRPENLQLAWKQVRANKGAAGVDGMTIDEFPDWVKSGNWKRLLEQLNGGNYKPSPVRRVEIE